VKTFFLEKMHALPEHGELLAAAGIRPGAEMVAEVWCPRRRRERAEWNGMEWDGMNVLSPAPPTL